MSELTVFPDVEQRSDAWYEQRRGLVTASAVGSLLTSAGRVAANDTSRSLLMTLAAERITGVVEPTFTSEAMWRGIEDEPIARAHYAEHRAPVETCGFAVRDFGKFKLGCSPDGLVGDDGLIEIKSRAPKAHLATVLSNQVPAANMAQCQAALLVFGRDWLDYISWCGGMPMWVIRVLPDAEWFDAITAAVENAEQVIDGYCTDFLTKVAGLPATERIDRELEMVI